MPDDGKLSPSDLRLCTNNVNHDLSACLWSLGKLRQHAARCKWPAAIAEALFDAEREVAQAVKDWQVAMLERSKAVAE